MKVLLSGAGSGGHITPLLAVAKELNAHDKNMVLAFVGQTGDPFAEEIKKDTHIKDIYSVKAGKFRRYHGEGWKQVLDLKTLALNIRDFFYVIIGFWQSCKLLKQIQPDVIFIKGGFVGVPVGLAAASLKIPYITHDSDSVPGLANRIIARWATWHAVALPADIYSYPSNKTVTTGIPLRSEFEPVDAGKQAALRKQIEVTDSAQVLFIIGGGLGSALINQAAVESVPHLLAEFPKLQVFHITGKNHFDEIKQKYQGSLSEPQAKRLKLFNYTSDVYAYSGAADLVVTRGGATNLAEFSVQGKACVIVPSPFLTGGHQLKNADFYVNNHAAVTIRDEELSANHLRLAQQVSTLLHDPQQIKKMAINNARLARAGGAKEIADLIIKTVNEV